MGMACFHRKYASLALLSILALAGGSASGCKADGNRRNPFGGELPPSASDVLVYDVDMFPDWEYYVRASMSAQDCEDLLAKVASREGLQPISEHRWLDGKGDWGPLNPPIWWQPPWTSSHHHRRRGDVNTCAMCTGGTFYYWTGSH